MPSVFGDLSRAWRIEARFSIGDVARHLGYSIPYVSDVERGRRDPYEVNKIHELATFLGKDAAPLLRAALESRGTFKLNVEGYSGAAFDLLSSLARGERSEDTYKKLLKTLKKEDENKNEPK
jgi:transcriptional regulator with XRE-family HTH domain